MLKSVAGYLQVLAGEMSKGPGKEEYHIAGVKIFFKAPNPRNPSSETLDITKDISKGKNFQWVAYQVLFTYKPKGSKDVVFYIYNVNLKPNGTDEKQPNKVFESDSIWSNKNIDKPSNELLPAEVKLALEILKGPNLFPPKEGKTIVYVNTDAKDPKKVYSSQEFEKKFRNNFYIVFSTTGPLKNPFGDVIGEIYPKEQP